MQIVSFIMKLKVYQLISLISQRILMAWRKTTVTPLLMHWSYCNLALSPRYKLWWISRNHIIYLISECSLQLVCPRHTWKNKKMYQYLKMNYVSYLAIWQHKYVLVIYFEVTALVHDLILSTDICTSCYASKAVLFTLIFNRLVLTLSN